MRLSFRLQVAIGASLALVVAYALTRPEFRAISYRLSALLFLGALFAYFTLTLIWSEAPRITVTHLVGGFAALAVALDFAVLLDAERRWLCLRASFAVIAASCFFMIVLAPTYGTMSGIRAQDFSHIGAWRGVYMHKNVLGAYGALGFGLSVLGMFRPGPGRSFSGILVAAFFLLVFFSTSKTSLLLSAALLTTGFFVAASFAYPRARKAIAVTFVGGGLAAVSILVAFFEPITEALGGDPTLTGRTLIWRALIPQVAEHPWYGVGLGAFWRIGENATKLPNRAVLDIQSVLDWAVPHAHNGYLDLAVETGLVGLGLGCAVLLILLIFAIRRAFGADRPSDVLDAGWPLIVGVHFFLLNFTESFWTQRNATADWCLVLAAYVLCCQRTLSPEVSA